MTLMEYAFIGAGAAIIYYLYLISKKQDETNEYLYRLEQRFSEKKQEPAPAGPDPLCEEAIEIILATGKASASLLQRRLYIGYARAARILDELEEESFIGPANGAALREILKKKEE